MSAAAVPSRSSIIASNTRSDLYQTDASTRASGASAATATPAPASHVTSHARSPSTAKRNATPASPGGHARPCIASKTIVESAGPPGRTSELRSGAAGGASAGGGVLKRRRTKPETVWNPKRNGLVAGSLGGSLDIARGGVDDAPRRS